MIFEIFLILSAVVVTVSLIILVLDPAESNRVNGAVPGRGGPVTMSRWARLRQIRDATRPKKPAASKEVILAMAQTSVYALDDYYGTYENEKEVRDAINASAVELDGYRTHTLLMVSTINQFFDELEKVTDACQEKICEFTDTLNEVTEARIMMEAEVYKKPCVKEDGQNPTSKTRDPCFIEARPIPPVVCPELNIDNNDDMLKMYVEFVDENVEQVMKEETANAPSTRSQAAVNFSEQSTTLQSDTEEDESDVKFD